MAVAYEELKQTLNFTLEQATATWVVKIAWADIAAFITEFCGATYFTGEGFKTTNTANHPDYPWLQFDSMAIEPFMSDDPPHDPGDRNFPQGAKATITYKSPSLNNEEQPEDPTPNEGYLSHEVSSAVEMMTLPDLALQWDADDEPVLNIDAGIVISEVTHTLTWSHVVNPPWTWIKECQGKINEANIWGIAAETLLFVSYSSKRTWKADGTAEYTLAYIFIEKVIWDAAGDVFRGWNEYYRPGEGWDKVKRAGEAGADRFVYKTADFGPLLRGA